VAEVTAEGEVLARVAGRLRHQASGRSDFPAVGDWVALEADSAGSDARIRAVLPRHSRFSRRAAGDPAEEQIVAANIDTVFLVGGLDGDFNPRRIERYLLVASESGATPVVVLNKADLVEARKRWPARCARSRPAWRCTPCRAASRDRWTCSAATWRQGTTAALLGSSGVGKSTIVNRLVGFDLLRTRDVRVADSRGRHTSTSRQMVLLPEGGVLIDTPGMRELQLWETGEALAGTFGDIDALAEACRFRDCRHRQEPGCAVRAATDAASCRRPAGELPQAPGRTGAPGAPGG
jgi:ribosome biogenesis GTPase / thiamine phosphate phosphatase